MHEIKIEHFELGAFTTSPEEMAILAGVSFPIAHRVPGAVGEAFDWQLWYSAWIEKVSGADAIPAPSELTVEAADTFEAFIPWDQLGEAAVLYGQNGEPLQKTGPIRLYVPNGSSKCLNVKSIVKLRIGHNAANGTEEATYGFKHTFSADELRKNK
ncbi:hypothetical protein [Paenibacillus sp. LHD-38]|uniref:hypothetical protein n=1 Tax=Paenibacillus sp. LHD-38 TaxID=3072143 RepID=UPI00280C965D|nr:hypothetical protein [Paenibacillus sp. LHD-38]MDQ8735731.1 hypothetical protein [Paenibacillus sp. LHD-38]